MVYSGIYSLPKSNSTLTIKSEQSSSNLNNTNTTNTINNGLKHSRPKNGKKANSDKNSSKLSNNEDRFNDNFSNVTSKSDTKFKNCSPKLAPEIIFLIKEHAKTLETINLISKRLQEIELKVDDMSQRLNKETSNSNNDFSKVKCGNNLACQKNKDENSKTDPKSQSFSQKDFNLNRYSNYKELDQLSNNNSNNANLTNIPNNQILSDDSGGEYGNKTKTVSEDDELLSILDKITKCSHHILQTQQAHQNQTNAVYNSLSKQFAYNNGTNLPNANRFTNQNNHSIINGLTQNHKTHLNPNLNGQNFQEVYYTQNYHPAINPYMLNAKIPIKIPQQQNIVPLNYTNQQQASLNELLFEPNVERFLSNLDQLVCNDDTNFAAILNNNNQQPTTRYINPMLSVIPIMQQNQQHLQTQSYIPTSPHHQTTSTSKKPITNLTNRRNNCVEINNLNTIMKNSDINSNYNFLLQNQQHIDNLNYNKNNVHAQQFLNWQKSKELFELKERERIDNQLKQADEWLNNCLSQNKYQTKMKNFASGNGLSNSTNHLNNNLIKGDKNEILKEF